MGLQTFGSTFTSSFHFAWREFGPIEYYANWLGQLSRKTGSGIRHAQDIDHVKLKTDRLPDWICCDLASLSHPSVKQDLLSATGRYVRHALQP